MLSIRPIITVGPTPFITLKNLFAIFKQLLLNAQAYREIILFIWENNQHLQRWYMGWEHIEKIIFSR